MRASKAGRDTRLIFYSLAIAALLSATAVGDAQLNFLDTTDLSGIGLRLRIMPDMREIPLPPPETFSYLIKYAAHEERVEMFRPYDLWMADQHAASWADDSGTELVIAIVRRFMPAGFTREHVTQDGFKKKSDKLRIPKNWTPAELAEWLSGMTGVDDITATPAKNPLNKFSSLVAFSFPAEEPRRIAYAFRLNPKALGQRDAAQEYFVASFKIAEKIDRRQAETTIRRKFLSYISTIPMGQRKATSKASRQFQAKRTAPTGQRTRAYQESLNRVTRSIANMKDWWYVETPHFILISNASARQRRTIKDIQADLGRLRLAFEQLIPAVKPFEAVSVIRIFGSDEAYRQHVDPQFESSDGMWSPTRRELIIRPVDEQSGEAQHRRVLETAYHESFHQYLFYALDQANTSPWYNEGHACFFEGSDIQKRGVKIGENASRLRYLQETIKKHDGDLKAVMLLDYDQFYADDMDERQKNYSLAWGLIYYLRKGILLDRHSPYVALLNNYEREIAAGRDATAATRELINAIDLEAFQQDFENFWRSSNSRNAAKRARLNLR